MDDYIGQPWVFIMEPPRHYEVEVPIAFIAPVHWEKEIYYL